MDMILLTVCFNKFTTEVATHPVEVKMEPFVHLFREDILSVFGNKDQMQMK